MSPPKGIHHDHAAMMMMILQGIWESQVGTGMTGGGGMTLVAQDTSRVLLNQHVMVGWASIMIKGHQWGWHGTRRKQWRRYRAVSISKPERTRDTGH